MDYVEKNTDFTDQGVQINLDPFSSLFRFYPILQYYKKFDTSYDVALCIYFKSQKNFHFFMNTFWFVVEKRQNGSNCYAPPGQ